MKSKTEQIFSQIFQDIKEEMNKNKDKIFLKEYTIPSINYDPKNEDIENMYFASGIEMELERIVSFFEYKIYYASYKDKYFFSNSKEVAQERMLKEIKSESKKEENKVDRIDGLKQKLFTKLEQELKNFKEKLKQKTADEIIESAYELTVKEEIVGEIKEKNLDKDELKALLKEDNLLSEFYEDWRNSDGRLGEEISYTMDDTIDIVVKEYEKEKNIKNKESR